ncbi:MAG: hypothetical protein IKQ87_02775 [Clostridia bacterium]|nr:hypothetical protein [Clostridia bacterium]
MGKPPVDLDLRESKNPHSSPSDEEKHGYLRDIAETASADMPIIAEIAAGCKRETGEGRNFTISGGKMKNAQKEELTILRQPLVGMSDSLIPPFPIPPRA